MKRLSTVPRIRIWPIVVLFCFHLPAQSLDGSTQNEQLQGSLTEQAQLLFKEKKFADVVSMLSKTTNSLDSEGLILLGNAYAESNNPMAAIKTYTLALSKKEKNFAAKHLIGQEYLKLKKDREALVALREALEFNSKYEPAYLTIENLYVRKNNKYELRTLYLDMIEQLGERPHYLTRLCELSYISGLYESAISQCRRGIVLNKSEAKNYVFLGLSFKETGKTLEANSLLKRAADNFTASFDAQLTYAVLLEEQKNYIESQKYFQKAVNLDPQSLKAQVGFAATSVELQKFQEGLEIFKKACKINKNAIVGLRKSIVSLKGFKATEFVTKYEELGDICGLSP